MSAFIQQPSSSPGKLQRRSDTSFDDSKDHLARNMDVVATTLPAGDSTRTMPGGAPPRWHATLGPPVYHDDFAAERPKAEYDPFFGPPVLLGMGGKGWEAASRQVTQEQHDTNVKADRPLLQVQQGDLR
jgi:hypothetical protein